MFGIDWRTVATPGSWEVADARFRKLDKPRGVLWQDNERPLRDARAHHLRLVKRADESYDVVLYRHTMVRYHKPQGNTHVVDVFMPWSGKSNWACIWECGYGWGSTLHAMRHKQPVWLHPYPSSEPDGWAAHLVFKRKARREAWLLDTTQSWQLQSYRYKYIDPTRTAKQTAIKERMRSLTLLLAITQTNYVPEYDTDFNKTFQSKHADLSPKMQLGPSYDVRRKVLSNLRQYAAGKCEELLPETGAGLVAWFKRVLDTRYSKDTSTSAVYQMTDHEIEAALVRLLEANNQGQYERVKVPVKMWRSGGNRPSRTRSFQTRAEAEKATEVLKQLKLAVDE